MSDAFDIEALLAAERDVAPPPGAQARVAERLSASIIATGSAEVALTTTASRGGLLSGTAGKLLLGAALVVGVGGVFYAARSTDRSPEVPAIQSAEPESPSRSPSPVKARLAPKEPAALAPSVLDETPRSDAHSELMATRKAVEVSPKVAPKVSPKVAPKVSPKVAPKVSPKVAPKPRPKVRKPRPKVAKVAPRSAPKPAPKLSPKTPTVVAVPPASIESDPLAPPPAAAVVDPVSPPRRGRVISAVHRDKSSLAIEVRILRRARRSLEQRQWTSALRGVAAHGRNFPDGQLREARMMIAVVAYAGLGDARRALAAQRAFLAQWPDSVFLPTVRRAVARLGPENPENSENSDAK